MKQKTTKKWIYENFANVIEVGYCNIQTLLAGLNPSYYTTRAEGWAADIYIVNNSTAIVTGYAPFGNIHPGYELQKKYEMLARRIIGDSLWDNQEEKLLKLGETISCFVNECFLCSVFTKNQYEDIKNNLNAFIANFSVPKIEKADFGPGYYVFYPADCSTWIQYCHNINYLDGWLYGVVQGVNRKEFANGLKGAKNYDC